MRCELLVVVSQVVKINDVEEDVIEHVGVKAKDEDEMNLDVGNLLKDVFVFVVHAVNLWHVDEVEMNVELSDDDLHSHDDKVDDKVGGSLRMMSLMSMQVLVKMLM